MIKKKLVILSLILFFFIIIGIFSIMNDCYLYVCNNKENKCVFIYNKILDNVYEYISNPKNKKIWIKDKNKKYYYVNLESKKQNKRYYDSCFDFVNNRALVVVNGKICIINENEEIIKETNTNSIISCFIKDNLIFIKNSIYNMDGKKIYSIDNNYIFKFDCFFEKKYIVIKKVNDNKEYIFNLKNKKIENLLFDYIYYIHNDYVLARINNNLYSYSIKNKQKKLLKNICIPYNKLFTKNGELFVAYNNNVNNRYGFIDIYGNTKIPFIYQDAMAFSENYAAVCNNDKWGYINKENKLIIDYKYTYASYFNEGNASVVLHNYIWAKINKQDKIKIKYYSVVYMSDIDNGFYSVIYKIF